MQGGGTPLSKPEANQQKPVGAGAGSPAKPEANQQKAVASGAAPPAKPEASEQKPVGAGAEPPAKPDPNQQKPVASGAAPPAKPEANEQKPVGAGGTPLAKPEANQQKQVGAGSEPPAKPEANQQKPAASGAAPPAKPEANEQKPVGAGGTPLAKPEANQQKQVGAGAEPLAKPEANPQKPGAPPAKPEASEQKPVEVRASDRELPPVSNSKPSAEQQQTLARLKEEAGSRPESDVMAMLRESAQEKVDMIRSLMDAQLEALRSAEASIDSAASRVAEDRRALLREHDVMQEALAAERAAIAQHRAALKEEREDVQLRLHEIKRREKLGGIEVNPFQAAEADSMSTAKKSMNALQFDADVGQSQQEQDRPSRRLSNNPFATMTHVQTEKKPEDSEPSEADMEFDASSIRGGPHVVVIGGYNDICLETFGVMAVSSDGSTVSPFKGEPNGNHMRYPRQLHAAAIMDNRRIFVAGGADANGVTNTTEVLDLESMSFTRGPKMRTQRQGSAMVHIDPYRMLVIGGFDGSTSLQSTEVLSLASMSFAPGPKLNSARWGCAAVQIDGNRVLVIGGRVGNWSLQTTEILDIATMTFSSGPRLGTRRQGCAAVVLRNRRVLVIGGREGASVFFTTEELDLDTMQFKPGPRLQAKRTFCAAVALDGGRSVLVLGGTDSSNACLDSTEVLREGKSSFESGPTLVMPRSCLAAALAPAIPPGPAEEKSAYDMRSDLIQKCFELCAPEQLMREDNLRRFARAAGLNSDKNDELGGQDFKTLLRDYEDEKDYVTLEHFAEMVDNQADVMYCSSHAMSAALQELRAQQAGMTNF